MAHPKGFEPLIRILSLLSAAKKRVEELRREVDWGGNPYRSKGGTPDCHLAY